MSTSELLRRLEFDPRHFQGQNCVYRTFASGSKRIFSLGKMQCFICRNSLRRMPERSQAAIKCTRIFVATKKKKRSEWELALQMHSDCMIHVARRNFHVSFSHALSRFVCDFYIRSRRSVCVCVRVCVTKRLPLKLASRHTNCWFVN